MMIDRIGRRGKWPGRVQKNCLGKKHRGTAEIFQQHKVHDMEERI